MKKPLNWIFFFGAVFCIVWFGSSRMRLIRAQNHVPIVAEALSHYPEFRKVLASFVPARGGELMVTGEITCQNDIFRIKAIVKGTNPPVKVGYFLYWHTA